MKHRAKVLTSLTLAAAMVASALPVPVLAASDTSGIDIVSETEAPVIEIQDGETEGEIVITEPDMTEPPTEDEIEVEAPKFGATLSLGSDDGIVMTPVTEGEETQAASSTGTVGDTKTLHVDAFNQETTDADLRLYFWDDDLEVPENPTDYTFANPADLIQLEGLTEESQVSIPVDTGEETVDVTADLVFEYAKDKETVTATYLSMELPADSEYAFDVKLSMDDPSVVTVVPEIVFEEDATSYAAWQLTWNEAEISVEPPVDDVAEEPSEDPIVIEKPENGSDITVEEPDDSVEIEVPEEGTEEDTVTDGSETETEDDVTASDDEETEGMEGETPTDDAEADSETEVSGPDGSDDSLTGIDQILNNLPSDVMEDSVSDETEEDLSETIGEVANEPVGEEGVDYGRPSEQDLDDVDEDAVLNDMLEEESSTDVLALDEEILEDDSDQVVEDKIIDPVVENYILEHADPNYASGDDMKLRNVLYVQNVLADASLIDETATVDSVMGTDQNGEAVWYVSNGNVAVYSLSDDDDYWVAFADTMHNDPNAKALDGVFALTDYDGNVVDGVFDEETGLAYIPKDAYIDEDGTMHVYEVQCEILQAVDFTSKMAQNVSSTVSVASETEDGEISQSQDTSTIFDFTTTVQVEKGLDESNMLVSVNGVPATSYDYDAETGQLELNKMSSDVQSVYVTEDADTVDPGVRKAALPQQVRSSDGPISPDQMVSVGTVTWQDGLPSVGNWYYFQLCTDYLEGFNHRFGGSYNISATGDHIASDADIQKLYNLIWYDGGSLDTSKIVVSRTYQQFEVWLDWCMDYGDNQQPDTGLMTWPFTMSQYDTAPSYDSFTMHCGHITTAWDSPNFSGGWRMRPACMRVLHVDTADRYMILGIVAGGFNEQAPVGLIKVNYRLPDLPEATVTVTKRDSQSNDALSGATFHLYTWSAATGSYSIDLGAFTDNKNGTYSKKIDLDNVYSDESGYWLLVKETSPPPGYKLDKGTSMSWVRYDGEQLCYNSSGQMISGNTTFYDTPNEGYLKVVKKSGNTSITNGNDCYSLADAVYTVYTSYVNGKLSGSVGTLRTGTNGESGTLKLQPGTYYVKETDAPDSYNLDRKVYTAKVTSNHTTKAPLVVTSTDQPKNDPVIIRIDKVPSGDVTGEMPSLAGTQFTIRYYDGYYNKNNLPSAPTRTWVIETQEIATGVYAASLTDRFIVDSLSDELYRADSNVCLPLGTITIQETKPASGFTLNGYLKDTNGKVVASNGGLYVTKVTEDMGVSLIGGNEFTSEDAPKPSNIIIKKFNGSNQPQSGTTYELRNSKGQVVGTATTGSNGIAEFRDLYPDTYTLTEIDTASGLTLLTKTITIKAPMTLTEREVIDNGIDKGKCVYDPVENCYYVFDQTYEITNDVTLKLPLTGATTTFATFLPLIGGTAVFAGSAAIFFKKKRK